MKDYIYYRCALDHSDCEVFDDLLFYLTYIDPFGADDNYHVVETQILDNRVLIKLLRIDSPYFIKVYRDLSRIIDGLMLINWWHKIVQGIKSDNELVISILGEKYNRTFTEIDWEKSTIYGISGDFYKFSNLNIFERVLIDYCLSKL